VVVIRKKVLLLFLVISLVGQVAASHETKTVWVPDDGECVEDVVSEDLAVDPSFDTKEDCQSWLRANTGITGIIYNFVAQIQIFINSLV
jgi:hypothetical protein